MAFIDWVMPGMDGGALIQAIRDRFGVQAPQMLVVSAYDTEELHQSIDNLSVKHFLPKPVLPTSLQQIFAHLHDEGAADGATTISQSPSLEGMRVLLVEDQPINQQLAMELLRNMGVSPDLAQHGEEAISMLAAHNADYYSLVLMDLQMPVLDGYETTKRLRADARHDNLPIVAMTAHVAHDERVLCLSLGMWGHIGKPIDPDELYRLVAGFYRRESGQKPAAESVAAAGQEASHVPCEERGANRCGGGTAAHGWARHANRPGLHRGQAGFLPEPAQTVRRWFSDVPRTNDAVLARRKSSGRGAVGPFPERRCLQSRSAPSRRGRK